MSAESPNSVAVQTICHVGRAQDEGSVPTVQDYRNFLSMPLIQYVVHERRLAGPEIPL